MAKNERLGRELARRLEQHIIERGWPVGELLGSESTLRERYGASLPVWREAVRLLEHDNVVTVRRGRGGGIVVAAPQGAAVVHAAAVYFRYAGVSAEQLHRCWLFLELAALEQVVGNLTDEQAVQLKEVVAAEAQRSAEDTLSGTQPGYHAVLAEITGEHPLRLLMDVIIELSTAPARDLSSRRQRELSTAAVGEHRDIVDAIIDRDLPRARQLTADHLEHARIESARLSRRRVRT